MVSVSSSVRRRPAGPYAAIGARPAPGASPARKPWFEEHGDRDQAIRHALAAPDFELAAQLIGRAHPDLLEPLSGRELDVLRLLRSELSGPEIASEPRVSLNTLRTHTKNIFEKLAVNSRRAAVHRAEDLNLPGASQTR